MSDDQILDPPSRPAWWQAVGAGVLGAVAVNLVLYLFARAAGASLALPDGSGTHVVGVPDVVGATVVPLLVGTVLAVLLSRRWPVLLRVAQVGGAVVALVTVAGPLTGDTDAATRLVLAAMHVVSAVAVVAILEGVHRGRAGRRRTGTAVRAAA
ncbi:hypothetical protein CLV92_108163 [Kineococcus xinjiangensis]|uniref:Uncharacterized protein n=1 Tax=Kineococcus xinjiangensis TaxID=512762 RepID=A0A2S6IJ94_9ACTN|nr:DUF6069 family protein [Kineococcus xinjiangensis]PPK94261.1 hypothetical protein CLV92_108163 [Kineococcus xinjiangensis]